MRVIVAGAGIAGLALGGYLQRAGHEVVVLEEAEQLRTGGAAISIWNNGGVALRNLGTELGQHGRVIESLEMWSSKGSVVGRIDTARLSREFGIDAVTIPRGELLELLASGLEPGTIRFSSACRGVREEPDKVIVEVGGGDLLDADLVVGADGHRSAVRTRFASDGAATPTGWASLQGLTPAPLPVTGGGISMYVVGPGGAVGLMPAGRGLLQWWFDVPWPLSPFPTSTVGWLRSRFAHWKAPVRDLLEVITEDDVEPYPHVWHRVPKHLHTDRIVLIGDAVHAIPPVLAQGANQSIEDAWVLASRLNATPSVSSALEGYERERRTKVAIVSRVARVPMVQLYGLMGLGPRRGPWVPERFCTWSWNRVMRSCSSTVPRAKRSR